MQKRKDRKSNVRNSFETMESRCLMSAAPAIPAGAIIHNGNSNTELTASMITSGSDAAHPNVYENYTVHGGQLNVMNISNVVITQCDVGAWSKSQIGIFVNDVNNVWVDNNTFHDMTTSTGIGALPTNIVNCHFDDNTFNNVAEGIHLDFGTGGGSSNNSVSSNYIVNWSRWGIELQGISTSGLEVMHNYLTTSNSSNAGGISNATGGSAEATAAGHFTVGTEIGFNVVLGAGGSEGAIEDSGSASNVHDNYIKNFGMGVFYTNTNLDGMNRPWYVTNNIFVGVGQGQINYEGSSQPGQYPPPVTSGNQVFALNAANVPAPPSVAATIGGTNTAPTPTPTVTPTFTATAGSDGVDLTLPAGGGTLTWTATGNSGSPLFNPTSNQTHTTVIPAGTTSFVDTSVPNNWQVYYTFNNSLGGVLSSTQITGPAAPIAVVAPAPSPIVAPVPPTPGTTGSPTLAKYIPISWRQNPEQAFPFYDGPLD